MLAALTAEFGFDFDPCPHPRPDGFDGLAVPWGSSSWCNPPFTGDAKEPGKRKIGPMAWARKALAERDLGKLCVVILPIYQVRAITFLANRADELRMIPGPVWLALEDGRENPAPPDSRQPCVLIILRPKATPTAPPIGDHSPAAEDGRAAL
jgi:hypothetical protein